MGRLGTPYNDILAQRAAATALSSMAGSSGYFSTPTPELDPRLFAPGSDVLAPEVRSWITSKLYAFWNRIYLHPQWWSTVWIAGSGITYQWSGGRATQGPGDLDVLVGVDWPVFFKANPNWQGTSDSDMAGFMNEEFHRELWPSTANAVLPLGGEPFEVTFYVNPEATDIRSINPYAAYNVTTDEWTVRPPKLGATPNLDVPQSWLDEVDYEVTRARDLGGRYSALRAQVMVESADVPSQLNALTALHEVLSTATSLFAKIHNRRKLAFSEGGGGYADFTNWAWQRHKLLGSGQLLHTLAQLDTDVHSDSVGQCYVSGLLDPQHALMLATRVVAREA